MFGKKMEIPRQIVKEIMSKKIDDITQLLQTGATGEEIRDAMHRVLDDAESSNEDVMQLLSPLLVIRYMDAQLFLACLERIAKDGGCIKYSQAIEDAFGRYYRRNEKNGLGLAIDLIAHSNGFIRHFGREIWDEYDIHRKVNIAELSLDQQVRVAASLLHGIMNPEKRLTIVMPLLNSPSVDLRQIIAAMMESYIINYLGVFRKVFTSTSLEENEEVQSLRSMMEATEEHFNYSAKCKELWSEYAYPTEYEICNRMIARHLAEVQKKTAEENKHQFVLLSMARNVLVARGGGMRMPNGHVQQLQKIEYSAQLPLLFAAMSPLENNEWSGKIFADWSKIGKDEQ